MPVHSKFLHKELYRLASYESWYQSNNVWPSTLARLGFSATGNGDEVICFACQRTISHWQSGDDPKQRHRNCSPECPLVTGQDVQNVSMVWLSEDFDHTTAGNNASELDVVDARLATARDVRDSCLETITTTSTPVRPEFYAVCRSVLNRAKRKTLQRNIRPVPAPPIDPNNPDYDLLRHEAARRRTFTNYPAGAPVGADELAKAGFFHAGPGDRVQCAFCRKFLRNWVPGDVAMTEHQRHMPDCPFVNGRSVGNVLIEDDDLGNYTATADVVDARPRPAPLSSDVQIHSASELDSQTLRNQPTFATLSFDANIPSKHPQYATPEARRQTFEAVGITLPQGQNIATLVDAGFFHVGPDDNVKCFCCDVGLKNWQATDNPWQEHARWFPRCTYIRQKRDAAFIANAERGRPAWNRHTHSTSSSTAPAAAAAGSETNSAATVGQRRDNTASSSSSSPSRTSAAAAAAGRQSSPAAAAAAGSRPRNRKNKKKEKKSATTAAAAAAASAVERENDGDTEAGSGTEQQQQLDLNADNDSEAEQLLEENRQLRDARTCRVCMDLEVNIVFLPCGHLVCCDSCAPALRNCAVCRNLIRGTVKVFLS